jgi:hypothetical protein
MSIIPDIQEVENRRPWFKTSPSKKLSRPSHLNKQAECSDAIL